MKKSTLGVLIFIFCLFGIIGGISQQSTFKGVEVIYSIFGIGAVLGLYLWIAGRRSARRERTESGLKSKGKSEGRKAFAKNAQVYIVKLPNTHQYMVPSVCCSCLQPTDYIWPITQWAGLNRRSMDFRCCKTCSKEKYPWWTYRAPVSFYYDPRSGQMVFGFDNRQFASDFARLNGSTLV